MKIRKILCALTAAAMICSVSSCGCVAENPADNGDATTTSATTTTVDTTTNADTSVMDTTDEVTDEGIVTERPVRDEQTDRNEGSDTTGEAAYASSYMDMTKIGWGLGKEKNDRNQPVDAVNAQEKYKAYNAGFVAADGKIMLTFDEGYENGYTAEILDILKEKGVRAVFFVTYDYCRSSPELVQRMIDEGHTVGNHSYSHPSFPDCSEKEMIDEIMNLHDYVAEKFGYKMTLFRFPKGEFSEKSLSVAKSLGYMPVFWSFAYNDWDINAQPDKAEALEKIKASTHCGIYLLHAVSATNTAILGEVIDYWKAEGYQVGAEY